MYALTSYIYIYIKITCFVYFKYTCLYQVGDSLLLRFIWNKNMFFIVFLQVCFQLQLKSDGSDSQRSGFASSAVVLCGWVENFTGTSLYQGTLTKLRFETVENHDVVKSTPPKYPAGQVESGVSKCSFDRLRWWDVPFQCWIPRDVDPDSREWWKSWQKRDNAVGHVFLPLIL